MPGRYHMWVGSPKYWVGFQPNGFGCSAMNRAMDAYPPSMESRYGDSPGRNRGALQNTFRTNSAAAVHSVLRSSGVRVLSGGTVSTLARPLQASQNQKLPRPACSRAAFQT